MFKGRDTYAKKTAQTTAGPVGMMAESDSFRRAGNLGRRCGGRLAWHVGAARRSNSRTSSANDNTGSGSVIIITYHLQ